MVRVSPQIIVYSSCSLGALSAPDPTGPLSFTLLVNKGKQFYVKRGGKQSHVTFGSLEAAIMPFDHTDASMAELEAISYYSGIPSCPTPWTKPRDEVEAYRQRKELRPVFGHKLNTVWKNLGPKVCDFLDAMQVSWTTVDVVRFANLVKDQKEVVSPVVLWIGVAPRALCREDAHTVAHNCLKLLEQFAITDVEVEIRESIYTRSAGPSLLEPVLNNDPTIDVRGPVTTALGLSIAAQNTPNAQGTGGLYLAEGGKSKNVLLLTARHVVFPPPHANYVFKKFRTPRHNVLLLGTKAFSDLDKSIQIRIEEHRGMAGIYKRQILKSHASGSTEKQKVYQTLLVEADQAMGALLKLHDEVTTKWRQPSQRVIGHVVRSPPIAFSVGIEGFTQDYAIVELDMSKFKQAFRGNVIDLGTF